jgi:hypothetical protein
MASVHVPRLTVPRWARPQRSRRGIAALTVAVLVLAALTVVNGAPRAAYGATGAPFGGTPAAVPGTVYAANYDTGGQGVAYNVTSVNGTANSYRTDGVDLEDTADTQDTSAPGAPYDIGWTTPGQWFNYTVDVATAGTYTAAFRLSSPYGITDALHIANSAGTNLTGPVAVPDTGGYQTWTTVTASITLPAGEQTLTTDQDSNGWNIHFMTFTLNSGSSGPGGDQPYGGTPAPVPGTVQAANYDTGGQGVAYNVTSVNGTANSYRTDGVDLEVCSDTGCGYDIGWTAAGQWFNYTVDVAAADTYTVSLRVAAPDAVTDALHISSSSGTNLSGDVNIPATGGWQDWETVTTSVTLPAGVQTLTVNQDNAGWNYWEMIFSTSTSPGGGEGGFPSGFWSSSVPTSSGAIEFDFLNATNGAYPDSEVYWDVNGVEESIAESPYYTMTSCDACRIYFYLGSPGSQYQDFIELNSSGTTINLDTSRVDAFGLPLAVNLQNSDGSNTVVGEDYQVFSESRTALFTQFEDAVPAPFQQLATIDAPYNIPAPGDIAAFQPGGADAGYMTSYAASVGATETTQEVFGCAGGGSPDLASDPTLCAALNRCVAQFSTTVQDTPTDYYQNPPCNYYSEFWHSVAVNGLQYGFAYDDDNGQSSDISSGDAQDVQVAIGF